MRISIGFSGALTILGLMVYFSQLSHFQSISKRSSEEHIIVTPNPTGESGSDTKGVLARDRETTDEEGRGFAANGIGERLDRAFEKIRFRHAETDLEELDDLLFRAINDIESSREVRERLAEKLAIAFRDDDFFVIGCLESVFALSHPGVRELKRVYNDELKRGVNDWYALDGLGKLKDYLLVREKLDLLEVAFHQLRVYGTDKGRPALRVIANLLSDPKLHVSPNQMESAIQALQFRQSQSRSEHEVALIAKTLYRILPPAQGLDLALRNLSLSSSATNFQTIVEASLEGYLPFDAVLQNALLNARASLELDKAQEASFRSLLKLQRQLPNQSAL